MECHSDDGARLAELDNMTRCGTKNCVALLGLHVHVVGRLHPVLFYERSFPVAVPKKQFPMTQTDLLHVIFSKKERSSFDLPKKHNFQWHKLGCFNGSTSNGTNWSASSNLLQKGSLPMAQAGLLHLIWSASSNGASWFALFDFLKKIFPIAQTGLLHGVLH